MAITLLFISIIRHLNDIITVTAMSSFQFYSSQHINCYGCDSTQYESLTSHDVDYRHSFNHLLCNLVNVIFSILYHWSIYFITTVNHAF